MRGERPLDNIHEYGIKRGIKSWFVWSFLTPIIWRYRYRELFKLYGKDLKEESI